MIVASAVVTTYNRRLIVREAVESALRQTLSDCEVIVVDDGSTDDTAAELSRLFKGDSRLRIIRQANGGPPVARNTGIDAACGEYVALLDSDDIWYPNYLSSQVSVLQAHPEADMVLSNGLCHTPGGGVNRLFDLPEWPFPHTVDDMCHMSYMLPSLSVFRTHVLRELHFNPAFRVADDTELMWRFLDGGHRSIGNPETLAEYRAVCQPGGIDAAQLTSFMDPVILAQYDLWKGYSDRYPRAIDRDPDFHRYFVEFLLRCGRIQDARWHAERLMSLRPDDPDATKLWKRVNVAIGESGDG
ncbi:MAG: glycosyltransferase family 2 protein [Propionibacteriaceae bacterium]|nr:glycosyltransferase family 2 protein [Propionibacteriaceae bacterium]